MSGSFYFILRFFKVFYRSVVDILYYFYVYNIVTRHLYTLQIDHHNKPSNYLSLYKVIPVIVDCIPCAIH